MTPHHFGSHPAERHRLTATGYYVMFRPAFAFWRDGNDSATVMIMGRESAISVVCLA
jgi:hypothetical protein